MPELPEVECLATALRETIVGSEIVRTKFFRRSLRDPIPTAVFQKITSGKTVSAIHRRGKYLIVETEAGYSLFHLGMSGNIIARSEPKPVVPHTHVIVELQRPSKKGHRGDRFYLHFVDPRRFGRIGAVKKQKLVSTYLDHEWLKKLGPEPLSKINLSQHLLEAAKHRKAPIKNFLMDSATVVGVGNIYANESLFLAGIDPCRPAASLTGSEFVSLATAIREVLASAIRHGGTTLKDYRSLSGQPGYFAQTLQVYGRQGSPCGRCGNPVKETRMAGRSTFFCGHCQK